MNKLGWGIVWCARSCCRGCNGHLVQIVGLAAGLLLAVGCQIKRSDTAVAEPLPPPVRVSVAQRQDVPRVVETVGSAKASVTVQVRAQVDGQIKKIHFREGSEVKSGQLLFELDTELYEANLKEAESTLQASIAQQVVADIEKTRYEKLAKAGAAPQETYDKARATFDSSVATVAKDRSRVEIARLNLGYCKVKAPVSGVAGRLETDGGSLTRGYDTRPVVVINQIKPIYVEFALAEKMLPEIRHQSRAGLPLSVEVRKSNQGTLMKGTVVFIDNQVDSNTGTITLRAEFSNADLAIWPGEFFEVRLTLGIDTGVVVIPLSALGQSVGGAQTYVLDKDNRVSRRKLKVRRVDRELVLLDGGLEPGETVITDGVVRLADGLAVRVLPPAGEASP